jgi:tRNA uridine 5-carboxymethylaminomethyl modification enzyme
MFTSRAEFRLLLRESTVATRLTPVGRAAGLVGDEQWQTHQARQQRKATILELLADGRAEPAAVNDLLRQRNSAPLSQKVPLATLLARPGVTLQDLATVEPQLMVDVDPALVEELEAEVKFEGYIRRERKTAEKLQRMEGRSIPLDFDYGALDGLTTEARDKLESVRPTSVGQAARIPGVTPAAIANILIHLNRI